MNSLSHTAVVFVHGINVEAIGYSNSMQRRILGCLPKELQTFVKFGEVLWADLVRDRQNQYIHKASSTSNMRQNIWRKFIIQGLGDAAAYQKTKKRENSAYFEIQGRITSRLNEIDSDDFPDRRLIFVAHSLGCHIVSSYLWDMNRLKQSHREELQDADAHEAQLEFDRISKSSPFCRLDTLCGIVTMGNNMPLFTFNFGPDNVFPITRQPSAEMRAAFPGASCENEAKQKARWINFYSRNDLLGYPLKPLNDAYLDDERIVDIEVRSEGAIRGLLLPPLNALAAHTKYWTHNTVVKKTAELIEEIIRAKP